MYVRFCLCKGGKKKLFVLSKDFFWPSGYITNSICLFTADASSQETLVMRISNPHSEQPVDDAEVMYVLQSADLERYGYKKEVTTKLVNEPGYKKPIYGKAHFYYKVVDCSRMQEIIQELQTLMPCKISHSFFIYSLEIMVIDSSFL